MMLFMINAVISLYLLGGIVYFSFRRSSYSHIQHTISELGEIGAPDQKRVAYGLFMPVGAVLVLAGLFLYLQPTTYLNQTLGGLSASVGTGYVVAALFPCDKRSPVGGSTRQQIHNFGGFIEYAGGAYFLVQPGSSAMSTATYALEPLGYVVVICALLLSVQPLFPWRGLIQRIAELSLFGGLITASLYQT